VTNDSVRHLQSFKDIMIKYHGEIERLVYASEILCWSNPKDAGAQLLPVPNTAKCFGCPFLDKLDSDDPEIWDCSLVFIRRWVGNHVKQDDVVSRHA